MGTPQLPKDFDFTDPDVYAARLPTEELRELRRAAPIWWNEQPSGVGGFTDGGYWVVSKHRDVREVSRLAGGLHRRVAGVAVSRITGSPIRGRNGFRR
jgi:hypothetical protein